MKVIAYAIAWVGTYIAFAIIKVTVLTVHRLDQGVFRELDMEYFLRTEHKEWMQGK
jgi:hypothetical protein